MERISKADDGWIQETNPEDKLLEKERGMERVSNAWGEVGENKKSINLETSVAKSGQNLKGEDNKYTKNKRQKNPHLWAAVFNKEKVKQGKQSTAK